MDELVISGKQYISAKRAARENRYHPDYIGQLIRSGKIEGQKVGRSWYVLEDSLKEYLQAENTKEAIPEEGTDRKEAEVSRGTSSRSALLVDEQVTIRKINENGTGVHTVPVSVAQTRSTLRISEEDDVLPVARTTGVTNFDAFTAAEPEIPLWRPSETGLADELEKIEHHPLPFRFWLFAFILGAVAFALTFYLSLQYSTVFTIYN